MALNEYAHWSRQGEFPMTAKLERTDGSKGRDKSPRIEIRARVLASFVQERVDSGEKYLPAIKLTHEWLVKTGKAEHWPGTICEKTVKDAYDAHSKGKGRN